MAATTEPCSPRDILRPPDVTDRQSLPAASRPSSPTSATQPSTQPASPRRAHHSNHHLTPAIWRPLHESDHPAALRTANQNGDRPYHRTSRVERVDRLREPITTAQIRGRRQACDERRSTHRARPSARRFGHSSRDDMRRDYATQHPGRTVAVVDLLRPDYRALTIGSLRRDSRSTPDDVSVMVLCDVRWSQSLPAPEPSYSSGRSSHHTTPSITAGVTAAR